MNHTFSEMYVSHSSIYYAILKKKEEREIGNDVFLCFKTAAEILRCESFRF